MIEIIILIFLVRRIVAYAKLKGLKGWKWSLLLLLNWFMFELLGVSLATYVLNIKYDLDFAMANPGFAILINMFGMGCGFLGYFLTRRMLDRSVV